eukprot:1159877-Pelagomonas_calceolata.AAC.14
MEGHKEAPLCPFCHIIDPLYPALCDMMPAQSCQLPLGACTDLPPKSELLQPWKGCGSYLQADLCTWVASKKMHSVAAAPPKSEE